MGAHCGALVAGLLIGCAGSFVQETVLRVGGAAVPVGLVAALAVTVAGVAGAGRGVGSRTGAAVALAGWLVAAIAVSLPRPEGDLVVAADATGLVWLYGGALLGGACTFPPYAAGRMTRSSRAGAQAPVAMRTTDTDSTAAGGRHGRQGED